METGGQQRLPCCRGIMGKEGRKSKKWQEKRREIKKENGKKDEGKKGKDQVRCRDLLEKKGEIERVREK